MPLLCFVYEVVVVVVLGLLCHRNQYAVAKLVSSINIAQLWGKSPDKMDKNREI